MSYALSELSQRVARMIRFGNVHSIQASPPRCRVTFGSDPISGDEHVTDWLHWSASVDDTGSEWRMPAVGAAVMVLSPGGNVAGGLVLPAGYTDDRTPPSTEAGQHVTQYSDGAMITYDTATHAMNITLPASGVVTVIAASGIKLQGNTEIEGNLAVNGDISDKTGSLQQIRDAYNAHDHNENGDGGGVTDPPNQKMQSEERTGK